MLPIAITIDGRRGYCNFSADCVDEESSGRHAQLLGRGRRGSFLELIAIPPRDSCGESRCAEWQDEIAICSSRVAEQGRERGLFEGCKDIVLCSG